MKKTRKKKRVGPAWKTQKSKDKLQQYLEIGKITLSKIMIKVTRWLLHLGDLYCVVRGLSRDIETNTLDTYNRLF